MESFDITQLINPEFYIQLGGLWLVIFIVFAETGLFAGFFLPGDSLLFVSGIYAHELVSVYLPVEDGASSLFLLVALTALAAIIGNIVGYMIGNASKTFFYHAKDRWYFKRKYLNQAHGFYEKYGGMAVSFARFLPMIRTFVPVVAGIVSMRFSSFFLYTILGGILWPLVLQLAGYYLHAYCLNSFNVDIKSYIEFIIIGIIVVTTVPVFVSFWRSSKTTRKDILP